MKIAYMKEIAAVVIALVMGSGSIITGWLWVDGRFMTKQEGVEMYLEMSINNNDLLLMVLDNQINDGAVFSPNQQRRYDLAVESSRNMSQKRNELMGL